MGTRKGCELKLFTSYPVHGGHHFLNLGFPYLPLFHFFFYLFTQRHSWSLTVSPLPAWLLSPDTEGEGGQFILTGPSGKAPTGRVSQLLAVPDELRMCWVRELRNQQVTCRSRWVSTQGQKLRSWHSSFYSNFGQDFLVQERHHFLIWSSFCLPLLHFFFCFLTQQPPWGLTVPSTWLLFPGTEGSRAA